MARLSVRAATALEFFLVTACAGVAAFAADHMRSEQVAAAMKPMIGVPVPGPVAAPPPVTTATPILLAAYSQRYRDGVSTGPAFDAYYGMVQVQAVIRDGRLVAVSVLQHPSHYATSRSINAWALPRLEREVIRAQSADVHAVSGATLTSHAFIRSISAALRKASG